MSEKKKIYIEDLGLKTDEEALDFVRKLRQAGVSIFYHTDGDKDRWIGGVFEEIPILPMALKLKIDFLEKEISIIKSEIAELKTTLKTTPPSEILQPLPELPIESKPKPMSGFTFKPREEKATPIISETNQPTIDISFNCPSCGKTFTEKIPKGKKIVEVSCPNCGSLIYKKKWWTRRKVIGLTLLAVGILFLIWLLT